MRTLDRLLQGLPRATFVPAAMFVFLGMAGSVVLRSWADATFLDLAGVGRLPYLLVASATLLALLSGLYSLALNRLSPAKLDRFLILLFAVVAAAPAVVQPHSLTAAFVWALVLGSVGPMANIIAWSWAAAAIDARTAKRAMPLLGAAATAGAVLLGAMVPPFVRFAGTAHLPWAAGLLYAAMSILPALIDRRGAVLQATSTAKVAVPDLSRESRPLVTALVVFALLESLAAAIADFQLKAAVQSAGGRDRIAMVLAVFHGATSAGVLLLQVGLVGRVLARLGVQVGLLLAPVAMLLGTLGIIAVPGVAVLAAGPKLADGLLKFSFGRSALEVAMIPLGDLGRRKAKVLVRGLPGPLGNILAGGLLLLVGAGGAHNVWGAAALIGVPVILLWIGGSVWVLRAYLQALRAGLRIRRVDLLASSIGSGSLERGAQDGLVEMVVGTGSGDAGFAGEILAGGLSEREADRLCGHADARIRRIAWSALARLPSPRRPLPLELARRETDDGVRELVLTAFGRRRDDRLAHDAALWLEGAAPFVPPSAGPHSLTGFTRFGIGQGIEIYLGTLGRLARPALERVARTVLAADGGRAGELLRGVSHRGGLTEDEALLLISGTRDTASRASILQALVAFGTEPALREVLREFEGGEFAAAARALAAAPAEIGEVLAGLVAASSPAVRERVARALGVAPDIAVRLGGALLADAEPAVRAAVARSLVRLRRSVVGLRPPAEAVAHAVRTEIRLGSAYRGKQAELEGRNDAAAVFARTEITIRLTRVAERLFLLLALGGDARTLQAAMRRFHSGQEDLRRSVLTLLEDMPSTPLRGEVVAYLEARTPPPPDGEAVLAADTFLAACLADAETLRALRPRIEALRATTLFSGLPGDVLRDLAGSSEVIDVVAGEAVVKQGESGDALFAVMQGELAFEKDGRVVGKAMAGSAFGELAVIDGAPRGATARAQSAGRLLKVSRKAVHAAMEHHPDLWQGVARSVARWFREAQPA